MHHLNPETLARLVDETPDATESAHLAGCAECREELAALGEQTRCLAGLPDLEPPAASWHELERRLAREGVLRRRWNLAPALRIAAGLALFLLGGVAGMVVRPGVSEPAAVASADAAQQLRQAEAAYRAALAQYTESSGTPPAANPAARLATLETIVLTTQEALRQAPADPVINGYHFAAVSQRDATIRTLARDADQQPWY